MNLCIIPDLAVIALFVVCIGTSVRAGMVKSSKNILSLIITITIMTTSHSYIAAWLSTSGIGNKISEQVSIAVEKRYNEAVYGNTADSDSGGEAHPSKEKDSTGGLSLIDRLIADKSEQIQTAQDNLKAAVTKQLTDSVLSLIAVIILYFSVRIILFLLFKILGLVFELPLLRSVNKLAGGLIGIANALFIIWLLSAAAVLLLPGDMSQALNEAVQKSIIAKYFFENNMLLKLLI